MDEGQSVQEHLSHFQNILIDLLNVGEKVEEKTTVLVLLASLLSSYVFGDCSSSGEEHHQDR